MSKTISKILVICAMVVVLPLLVVGTTFASYYSVDATLLVSALTNGTSTADTAYAKVAYGEKSETSLEITESHLKTIKLDAVSNGYDFNGWYTDYGTGEQKEISTDTALSVSMSEYDKLTAVFTLKSYTVSYSYTETPNGETKSGSGEFSYGDALPTFTQNGYTFGWKVVGDETNTIHTVADFETSGEVEIEGVWTEENKITVTYYNGENLITTAETYANHVFTLGDPLTIMNASDVEDGYEYSWKNASGEVVTSIRSTENTSVYLNKEAITYSLVMDCGEAKFDNASTSTLTFTVEDTSALSAWADSSKWTTDYSFWKVTGFTYSGTEYNLDAAGLQTLATALVESNPRGTTKSFDLTANITKYFTTFAVTNSTITSYALGDISVYIYNDLPATETAVGAPFSVNASETSSTSTIYSFLTMTQADGQIVKVYKGTQEDYTEVTLQSLVITVNGFTTQYKISGTETLNDLIEKIYEENLGLDSSLTLSETLTVSAIKMCFA